MFSIYGLFDPIDPGHIRYVGYTKYDPIDRLFSHIKDIKSKAQKELNKKFVNWTYAQKGIGKILSENRTPRIFTIIETSTLKNAHILERLYIREYRKAGHQLWNLTEKIFLILQYSMQAMVFH